MRKMFKAILAIIKDKLFRQALNLFGNSVGIGTHSVFSLFVPFTVCLSLTGVLHVHHGKKNIEK